MSYGMSEFVRDTRAAIDPATRKADIQAVRANLEKLVSNSAFVMEHCGKGAVDGIHELYRDPETGFLLLAHVYPTGKTSPPHDHGASWAVYCQAVGWTDMTEYERIDDGSRQGYAEIRMARKYRLEPGQAGAYGPHQIHQIHFPDGARFIRVTGTDLAAVKTLRYDPAAHAVFETRPGETAGAPSA